MMVNEANLIPANVLKHLRKIRGKKALLFTGSRCVGKATLNSDWDFFVILDDKHSEWRNTSLIDKHLVEVFCINQKDLLEDFNDDLKDGRGITIGMFVTGNIIDDDSNGTLESIIRKANNLWHNGPSTLTKEDKDWIGYDVTNYIHDIEDCLHDDNKIILLLNHATEEFVKYWYRLNLIWLSRPKDRDRDFVGRTNKYSQFVEQINNAIDWKIKADLVIKFGQTLLIEYSLPRTGEIHLKLDK